MYRLRETAAHLSPIGAPRAAPPVGARVYLVHAPEPPAAPAPHDTVACDARIPTARRLPTLHKPPAPCQPAQ